MLEPIIKNIHTTLINKMEKIIMEKKLKNEKE